MIFNPKNEVKQMRLNFETILGMVGGGVIFVCGVGVIIAVCYSCVIGY